MTATTASKRIEVYVRLGTSSADEGDETVREVSFRLPDGITQKELLDRGFAIDGNSASMAVTAYSNHTDGRFVPLAEALHDVQVDLVKWLGEKGYEVQFE